MWKRSIQSISPGSIMRIASSLIPFSFMDSINVVAEKSIMPQFSWPMTNTSSISIPYVATSKLCTILSIGCVTLLPAVFITMISPRLKPNASSSMQTKRVSIHVTIPSFFVGWLVNPAFGNSGWFFTYSLLVSIICLISIIRYLIYISIYKIDSIHYIQYIQ